MYQPHWGDISALFGPGALPSTDECPPYGLVGSMNPFPAILGFMFGMYLERPMFMLLFPSFCTSLSDTSRIDLDFLIADLVGLCKFPFADEYGLLVGS